MSELDPLIAVRQRKKEEVMKKKLLLQTLIKLILEKQLSNQQLQSKFVSR